MSVGIVNTTTCNLRMSRFKRLAKEGSWIVIGQIAVVLGALMLVRVLTEYLAPSQYGQLALGLTIAGLVNQVVIGGLTAGIGRFYSIAAEKNDLPGFLNASRGLMGYATVAAASIGLVLCIYLISAGKAQWLPLSIAVLILSILSGINSSLNGIQNAARQRAVVALHSGMDAWLKIGLAVGVMFWLGSTSTAVVIGYVFSSLLIIASQFVFLRPLIKNKVVVSKSDDNQWERQIWGYSWPMAVGGLFNWGYYASQRWALELFTTTEQVGYFFALTQIAYTPINMAAAMFMSFLTPILFVRAGAATNADRIKRTHAVVIRIAFLGMGFTLLTAGVTYFIHEIFFGLLVASEYRQMSYYMPYIVLSAGILAVSQALALIVAVQNQTKKFLPLAVIGNGLIATLNLLFTHLWGIDGLVISIVIGAAIHFIWMLMLVLDNIKQVNLKVI